jgi:hypothetical protein
VISGVTGEGINTVLRAMVRQISDRRASRAAARPVILRAPVTRAERQSVSFKSPVVAKSPEAELEMAVKSRPPVQAPKKKAPKAATPAPKAKKKAAKAGGRAKARPKPARHSAKARAKKKAARR